MCTQDIMNQRRFMSHRILGTTAETPKNAADVDLSFLMAKGDTTTTRRSSMVSHRVGDLGPRVTPYGSNSSAWNDCWTGPETRDYPRELLKGREDTREESGLRDGDASMDAPRGVTPAGRPTHP